MVSTLAAPASRRRRRQHAVASALAGATLVGGRGYRRGLFGRPALRLDVSRRPAVPGRRARAACCGQLGRPTDDRTLARGPGDGSRNRVPRARQRRPL